MTVDGFMEYIIMVFVYSSVCTAIKRICALDGDTVNLWQYPLDGDT